MSDGQSNPLIAQAEDSTEWYSGVTLFETVSDTYEAISSGSWVEAGLGIVGVGLEVAAVVVDPFGTLAGFGVGWLIEHVEPLQEALNWVAGDPDQIQAYAKTWSNVSEKINEAAQAHKQSVEQDISEWTGATATAYRARAAETADALAAATKAAEAASQAIEMAGGVVAAVRMVVRDIVAQTVGRLAVWAAEAVFTLGVGIPVVATQAAVYVAKTMNTISKLFRKLASTMSKLTPAAAEAEGRVRRDHEEADRKARCYPVRHSSVEEDRYRHHTGEHGYETRQHRHQTRRHRAEARRSAIETA
ncbi:hypothetical protein APR12_006257 [Nocardia amikacinitolerans]|uniref:hypothetical protein n=1 Tax=Nocardia amikacinitolerans TaxID=756689 RepID=UPI00083482D3|nr:hypothetical protein [Nocardia amikacinitolerans]MCP2320867.1 hypothetical protein [Nocardia amikacinitolerans]